MASHPPAPLPAYVDALTESDPSQVDTYQLIGRLGSGGMGTVYAAVSPGRERVALKVAHPDHAVAEDFEREIAMMRRVEGVCGVGVHDGGTLEGRPWAAIEYVPGLSLRRHVGQNAPFEGEALLTLAAGCAEALANIHAAGVAHGDIKPGNVLLAPSGPKVVDYGIARLLADPPSGSVAGSPGWLAPERYRGGAPDAGSDVFAWACLVVFAATGEAPFGRIPGGGAQRRAALAEMARRADRDTVDLDALPEELRPVLRRALSSDPAARPPADEAYLECLVLLGEDRTIAADTWADRLRALLTRYWPDIDVRWDNPSQWVAAAVTLSATGSVAPQVGDPVVPASGEGAPADTAAPETPEPSAIPGTEGAEAGEAPETRESQEQSEPPGEPGEPGQPAAPDESLLDAAGRAATDVPGAGGAGAGIAGTGGAAGTGTASTGAAGGTAGSGVAGGTAGSGVAGGTAGSGVAGGTAGSGVAGAAPSAGQGSLGSTAAGGLPTAGASTETLVPLSLLKMSSLVVVACILTGIIAGGGAQFLQSLATPAPQVGFAAEPGLDPREPDFPYTREGSVFQSTGRDATETFTVTGIERTDEYTVLHFERATDGQGSSGPVHTLSIPMTLFDPVGGFTAQALRDGQGVLYGSVSPRADGHYPSARDAVRTYRRYFPRLPDEVEQVTFLGSGLGAMTGIPVEDVDEERPDPVNPNGADMARTFPDPGEEVEFENRRPEPGFEETTTHLESFVEGQVSALQDGQTGLGRGDRSRPAPFSAEPITDIVATEQQEDVQLEVHPAFRDGVYAIVELTLTNTGPFPVTPDLGGEGPAVPDAPADLISGNLGGFQLIEPVTGTVRYVTYADFGGEESRTFADEVHSLQPGNSYHLMAVFPSPPRSVQEVTLNAGEFGQIEGVPLL